MKNVVCDRCGDKLDVRKADDGEVEISPCESCAEEFAVETAEKISGLQMVNYAIEFALSCGNVEIVEGDSSQ